MSQTHSPLAEQPVTDAAAPPAIANDRKRAYTFCASSFGVVRLEDITEIANLKADLVACYRPVNSQEMFALERMAIAQQLILRAARLDAGLFTSAMNEVLNLDNNPIVTLEPDMIGCDIEITRQQNRNFCTAEGFRRLAKESNLMNLALRYRIQAERDYRRALEEFQRLERLRSKLPNEPNLLTDPDAENDIAPVSELNPRIPVTTIAPPQNTSGEKTYGGNAKVIPTPASPSGNVPVAAFTRINKEDRSGPSAEAGKYAFLTAFEKPALHSAADAIRRSLTNVSVSPRALRPAISDSPAKTSRTRKRDQAGLRHKSTSRCRPAPAGATDSQLVSP